jgi:hypothetical protein
LFVAWFVAFELASAELARGSVEAGFHYYFLHHCCCSSWPSEECGLIEISERRGGGGELHAMVVLEEKDSNSDGVRDTQLRFYYIAH